jgi:hypothetical protein
MSMQSQMDEGAHIANKLIEATKASEDYDLFFHYIKNLPSDEAFVHGFLGHLIDLAVQGSGREKLSATM